MAKKDNSLMIALGIAAVVMMSNKGRQQTQVQQGYQPYNPSTWQNNLAAEPPRSSSEWMFWATTAVQFYGAIDDLWLPGGPLSGSGTKPEDFFLGQDGGTDGYNPHNGSGMV